MAYFLCLDGNANIPEAIAAQDELGRIGHLMYPIAALLVVSLRSEFTPGEPVEALLLSFLPFTHFRPTQDQYH